MLFDVRIFMLGLISIFLTLYFVSYLTSFIIVRLFIYIMLLLLSFINRFRNHAYKFNITYKRQISRNIDTTLRLRNKKLYQRNITNNKQTK